MNMDDDVLRDKENNDIREAPVDEVEITKNDVIKYTITKNESLGQGKFGRTYKGNMEDKTVAIKEPFKNDLEEKEIKMLRDVRHKNIVRYLGHCHINRKFCLVMELADNGDLCSILHSKGKRRFCLTDKLKDQWIREIACGLEYLHDGLDNPILHGDVKSPNVLIFKEPQYVAKLSDFGLSEELLEGTYTFNGNPSFSSRWAAPETVKSKRTKMSDVWSYGALVWEILKEKLPHHSQSEEAAIIFTVGNGGSPYNPEKDDIPSKYKEMLDNCFIFEHNSRWLFKTIIRYLDDYKDRNPLEPDGDVVEPQQCVLELKMLENEFYRRATYEFVNKMKDEELLKKVKHIFREEIPRGIRDRIKDGMDMVDKLETNGLLSSDHMEFVAKRLSSVGEDELANIFKESCSIDKNQKDEVGAVKPSDYCDSSKDLGCRSSRMDIDDRRGIIGSFDENTGEEAFRFNFTQPSDDMREVGQTENPMDLSNDSECKKVMFANEQNTRQIDSLVTHTSALDHLFNIVSNNVTKDNFWILARHLLGYRECYSELHTITRRVHDQRERTFCLLDLWCQRQKKKDKEPTCEQLVAALRASNLQRTASLVEKYMPYPQ